MILLSTQPYGVFSLSEKLKNLLLEQRNNLWFLFRIRLVSISERLLTRPKMFLEFKYVLTLFWMHNDVLYDIRVFCARMRKAKSKMSRQWAMWRPIGSAVRATSSGAKSVMRLANRRKNMVRMIAWKTITTSRVIQWYATRISLFASGSSAICFI